MNHSCERRPQRPAVVLLLLLAGCALPACAASRAQTDAAPADDSLEREIREKVYASVLPDDAKGFQLMATPRQWAGMRQEAPQSLEQYRAAVRVRPTDERRTIVLQPLGEFTGEQAKVLELLREYAATFFQLPARLEKPIALEVPGAQLHKIVPINNRHGTYDRQYNGDRVMLELLAPKLSADAVVYLGVTMADLYSGRTKFVFGVASLDKRVGVFSLCRYYPEFEGLERGRSGNVSILRRACKVLNHETGHMFGLRHCTFYRCSMNYSDSLPEADDTPIHECPVCHRKLLWNIGFEPLKRFAALKDFYQRLGLTAEAEWLAGRTQRWKSVTAAEDAKKAGEE